MTSPRANSAECPLLRCRQPVGVKLCPRCRRPLGVRRRWVVWGEARPTLLDELNGSRRGAVMWRRSHS